MDAILLAAGIGSRMELKIPKQFLTINGKPILIYSLEILSKNEHIENIILSCHSDYIKQYMKIVDDFKIKNVLFSKGGNTRQESVLNALEFVKSENVLIHEAARPLISNDFVNRIINGIDSEVDGVIPVIPINYTVAIGSDYFEEILDRSKLKNIQLPQVFRMSKLKSAHDSAVKDKYTSTEDGSLLFYYGGKVKFIEGRETNIKITTPFDIALIDKLLNLEK